MVAFNNIWSQTLLSCNLQLPNQSQGRSCLLLLRYLTGSRIYSPVCVLFTCLGCTSWPGD